MATPTFTFDEGIRRPLPCDGVSRATYPYDPGIAPVSVSQRSAATTYAYQAPIAPSILNAGSARTTCTYDCQPTSPRQRLISSAKSAICSSSTNEVWGTFANNEYWVAHQAAIVRSHECDYHLVEDLIQETYLQLGIELQKDPTLRLSPEDIETKILPWAFQIVRRRCDLYLRQRKREHSVNVVLCDVDGFSASDDRRFNSEPWSDEEIEQLRTELAKLASADQDVLNTFAEEDRSTKAIAESLSRSEHSVRRALTRLFDSLRIRLRTVGFDG